MAPVCSACGMRVHSSECPSIATFGPKATHYYVSTYSHCEFVVYYKVYLNIMNNNDCYITSPKFAYTCVMCSVCPCPSTTLTSVHGIPNFFDFSCYLIFSQERELLAIFRLFLAKKIPKTDRASRRHLG